MDNWQDKTEWKDLWLLTPEQVPLLSGMTDNKRKTALWPLMTDKIKGLSVGKDGLRYSGDAS